jgi:DNA-binding transcriptional regulator PaaX
MKPIRKIKAKHYAKETLKYLLVGGVLTLTGGGPAIGVMLAKKIFQEKQVPKKRSYDTFYYLRKKGLIEMHQEGYDISIVLTSEGKKMAGKYQIDDLTIEVPKTWDKKWRIILFDIPVTSNTVRNIFRKKLKEFGFYWLQKSVWVFPFECREEIEFLRDFLGVEKRQIICIEAVIKDDEFLQKHFGLQ